MTIDNKLPKKDKKVVKQAETGEISVTASLVVDEPKPVDTKLPKLTDKQSRFCVQYLIDLSVEGAANRANICYGYARQLLTKSNILNEIQRLKNERLERTQVKADDVVRELAKIASSNIDDYLTVDEDGETRLKSFDTIEREKLAVIESIKISTTKNKDDSQTYTTTQFKLHSKLNALEQLGKHLGIYDKDNEQRSKPFVLVFNHKREPKKVICEQKGIQDDL